MKHIFAKYWINIGLHAPIIPQRHAIAQCYRQCPAFSRSQTMLRLVSSPQSESEPLPFTDYRLSRTHNSLTRNDKRFRACTSLRSSSLDNSRITWSLFEAKVKCESIFFPPFYWHAQRNHSSLTETCEQIHSQSPPPPFRFDSTHVHKNGMGCSSKTMMNGRAELKWFAIKGESYVSIRFDDRTID